MTEDIKPDPDKLQAARAEFQHMDMIAKVLGDSFYPGGEQLTQKLGELMGLSRGMKVLNIYSTNGMSAITLVKWFEVEVLGIDPSTGNIERAKEKAQKTGFADRVSFRQGELEQIDIDDARFDGVLTECTLCTFPDKRTAISELHRVLKKGGRIGIADVMVNGELPPELDSIVSMILRLSDANSVDGYRELLREAGFNEVAYEDHSYALEELIKKGQKMLMGWNMVEKIFKLDLQKMVGITSEEAGVLLQVAMDEVKKGNIGYGLFVGTK